jgi:hypothetical protein
MNAVFIVAFPNQEITRIRIIAFDNAFQIALDCAVIVGG